MTAFAREQWMPEEQTIAKIRSRLYPTSARGFDLHLYPVGGPRQRERDRLALVIPGSVHDAQVARRGDAALTRP